jgi:hypothetical protein
MRTYLVSTLVLAACGASQSKPAAPGSRGLHANEHLDAARQHDEAARQRSMWPETRAADGTGRADQLLVGMPWHRSWDTVADQERAAAAHRSEAQAIHAAYEEACGEAPMAHTTTSPIVRYAVGGSPTADGVVLYLSAQAGPPERLMAELRCHRAWMRLAPANMDACPLDLAGLQVDAQGSAEVITLTLTVRDRSLIPELQRRAAHDLELGSSHSHR